MRRIGRGLLTVLGVVALAVGALIVSAGLVIALYTITPLQVP